MKILVIHASAGAGHMKAAEAVVKALKKYTSHEVTFVDALDHTSPSFKNLYRGSYFYFISQTPWLWGFFFALSDLAFLQPIIRFIRRIYNTVNMKPLHDFLQKENFDYIVSTHFMPNEISSALKRKKWITSKIISAVTDFDVHKIWLADHIDMYCVASEWTKEKLKKIGIEETKIRVTGIPTSEEFAARPHVAELKHKLFLKENLFTVLIATGSFGIGPIEELIRELKDFQVVVVCGHNKTLFENLSKNTFPNVKVCALVNNMYELMAVSDVMVTKPGGLSISEALVSQLPMIFFNAIPGQETNNIKVLGYDGIGTDTKNIKQIVETLRDLRNSRDKFQTALKRTQKLAKPSAGRDIISLIQ